MRLPEAIVALLTSSRSIGHFATSRDDVPHVTPVWLDYDEASGLVLVDVEEGTTKLRNALQNPSVALSFVAAGDQRRWVSLQGCVVDIAPDEERAHVTRLANRYLGRPKRNPG